VWWLLVGTGTFLTSVAIGVGAKDLLAGPADVASSARGERPSTTTVPPPTTEPSTLPPPVPTTTPTTTVPTTAVPATPPAPLPPTERVTVAPTSALLRDRVFVAGDSLTVQGLAHGPGPQAPADLEVQAGLGWTAANVQAELEAAVATAPVATLVVALGTNDSSLVGADGWTSDDVARFRRLIATPGDGACVVLVLPGHGPSVDPAYAAEVDEARAAMEALAWDRGDTPGVGPTIVVDWQAVIDGQPTLLSPDGIHLSDDPATGTISATSSSARANLYWQGVSQCQSA
jgi:hypothetical protein